MLKLQIPINSKGDVFEYVLDSAEVTVGRRHDNDIRIKQTYVSAYHATVIRGGDGSYFLRDRDSSNGTFHNGERVTRQVAVAEGDSLKFGKLDCWVVRAKASETKSLLSAGSKLIEKARHLPLTEALKSAAFPKGRKQADPAQADPAQADPAPSRELDWNSESKTELVTPPNSLDPVSSDPVKSIRSPETKAGGDGVDLLKIEINSLSKQLRSNQGELDRSREMVAKVSGELSDEKLRARKLESAVKIKETENNRISRDLRSAKIRADELEDDLARAKSQMANELKGALAQLEVAKNDNHLLQGTLDILEAEHKKHTQHSFDLAEKLKTTRKEFSPIQKSSDEKPSEPFRQPLDGEKQRGQVQILESQLSTIRGEFQEMESNYKERIRLTSAAQREAAKAASDLEQELAKTRADLKAQRNLVASQQETGPGVERSERNSDEDWAKQMVMRPGGIGDRDFVEAMNPAGEKELDNLRKAKAVLEQENEDLHVENKFLVAKVEQSTQEKKAQEALSQQNRTELEESARKLEEILQKLNNSEKRVKDLRRLEAELEKSVQRAQRNALSRKGIYSDEGDSSLIWPETEELICRELIERVELLEDLLRQYEGRRFFPNVAEQLNLLRDSFMTLLKNHSVDQFDLEPGTELSAESRNRIHLISVDEVGDPKLKRQSIQNVENSGRTRVLRTIRPGYIYRNGSQDVIIRKAEVVVA